MVARIALNGYGRIGQCVLRALYENPSFYQNARIVAINELTDADTLAYLTRYDSVHGRFPGEVAVRDEKLVVNGDEISLSSFEALSDLKWAQENIDIVFDCTGVFGSREDAQAHLASGAKRVLFSHPAMGDIDRTVVYGVNDQTLQAQDKIVSAASCTTNAIVPVLDAINQCFGIQSGMLTTIHSAMNDQPVIDAYHHKDLRRTRSALQNIVPVHTALDRGIERLLPELGGKLSTVAMRVPTVNVSAIDMTLSVQQVVSVEEVNRCLSQASASRYSGVLAYTEEPIASSDFLHDSHSGVIDGSQTRVSGQLVKVLTWFDNEWGFANRMLDVASEWLAKS